MASDVPQFAVLCVKTDFPHHLCKGVRYKVDPNERNKDKEIVTYWYHPIDHEWYLIGYFSLECFDTTPIRNWVNKKKGLPEEPVRQRAPQRDQQPERVRQETRFRVETRTRQS